MVEFGAGKSCSPSFGAVVGQRELKEALLAVTTDPALDGLLVRGEKGTAKSTTVRGLADLLPEQRAVADCPYGCHPEDPERQCEDCRGRADPPVETRSVPLVTLPLGATRDRVVGTLSVADALDGDPEFEPGLLARANRGLLYVDEVNLLEDHLVDVLLDAAAGGVNRVERDGVSVTHPAEFTLVGTMNPEEGELRPQLRDRFALQATVTACEELRQRVAVVERALGHEPEDTEDPADAAVRERLVGARDRLDDVTVPDGFLGEVAELCRDAGVEGHRADIATTRAARAFAALDDRERVVETDLRRAADLALPHRLASRPFEDAPDPDDILDDHFDDGSEGDPETEADPDDREGEGDSEPGGREGDGQDDRADDEPPSEGESGPGESGEDAGSPAEQEDGDGGVAAGQPEPEPTPPDAGDEGEAEPSPESDHGDTDGSGEEEGNPEETTPLVPGQARAEVGEASAPRLSAPEAEPGNGGRTGGGSRTATSPGPDNRGSRVRTECADDGTVDPAASVRAAATRGAEEVAERDLRQSVRAGETGALVVFVLDASASMRPAMRAAKGTALELLRDAYRGRDRVAVVAFGGEDAEVLVPPTDSVTLAARHLKELPTADRTPLPAGLEAAADLLDRADPDAATVVCVTDGRSNTGENPVADTRAAARTLAARDPEVMVVDAGGDHRGLTDLLVETTDADRVPLDALTPERVTGRE